MPVEIKELIIRAVVTPDPAPQPATSSQNIAEEEREAIIQACVRQLLRILRKKKER